MLKGAYSEKFKSIQQERLDQLKEERKESIQERSDRAKELSQETNRRRKALEERKREQQDNEEKTRKEVLAKRKQEQQEATQRFQKDTVQKKKLIQQDDENHTDKEPIPVRDGRYVVRGHVVEVRDGKQMPPNFAQPSRLNNPRNEMPAKYDFQGRYNGPTNGGILYAMNDSRNEGKLYSTQPTYDPYGTVVVPERHESYGLNRKTDEITQNSPVTKTLAAAEQEKLRADAIARSGPKLAFMNDASHQDTPEGALPCIMGRESPGGSVTSLDSLDEVPGKGKEVGAFSGSGILTKGGREAAKSAGKRKVTFSDSIEFDDGVTGQLVTEEKQSTKVYTMLYARNASSVTASAHSGLNQKGNRSAGTGPAGTCMVYSTKDLGKEPSVATVVHWDKPKPKPVAVSNHPTVPENLPSSSKQGTLGDDSSRLETHDKVAGEPKDETDVVIEQELNDSLEIMRDSLDEKDIHEDSSVMKQPSLSSEECKGSSTVAWTLGSFELKDSLERYVRSTAESTAEELIDGTPTDGGDVEERDRGLVCDSSDKGDQGPVTKPLTEKEGVYTKPGYITNPFVVTSGYQYQQAPYTSVASAVATSPLFYHHNAHVYNGLQAPVQGTFHQNFPYPFYTSAGTKFMGANAAKTEQHVLESAPVPFASPFAVTNYRPEDSVQSIEPQRSVKQTVSSQPAGHIVKREAMDGSGSQEDERAHAEAKSEKNKTVLSRQKHSTSPPSTVSSNSSSARPTRSLIPRPPLTKKTGRGRVHPGPFYRKQITARPRKSGHNHGVTSPRGQSVKNKGRTSGSKNNQTDSAGGRRNSPSPQSGNSRSVRNHANRPNSGTHDSADHDGIIEGIKRNMEMMNMRARNTAAEEQHQRILNSLRLEFGDGKREVPSPQESHALGEPRRGDDSTCESHGLRQDGASRRVHHPRVGSAGSRAGRPTGGSVKTGAAIEDGSQQAESYFGRPPTGNSVRVDFVNGDKFYQTVGPRTTQYPGESYRLDTATEGGYHLAGSHGGRLTGRSVWVDRANDHSYQLSTSRGNRPTPDQGRFDGYRSQGRAGDGVLGKPPYAPGVNHQLFHEERRHEYSTSTVGHPTSAASTQQEREEPLQAAGLNTNERQNSDLNRSISLDKTPTDDEINHLWAHVRSYLHSGSTKSVGSDSCVNRVDVRRSRTRSSSMQEAIGQRTEQQQNARDEQLMNGQPLLGLPPQVVGSTLGGLRRYGSHEVLRRDSSSESLSLKRSPLLQHRASRNRRPQKHGYGPNGRPPLPKQQEYDPSPSQAGPSSSVSTRGISQPLSPAEMQAVMMASEKEMLHRHQDKFTEMSSHQQYQTMMTGGRSGPSALSLEEQRLLQSLDRLNERLKAQEEITKAISQKPRMNNSGARKAQQNGQTGSGTRQAQNNPHPSNRNMLHTR